MSILESEIENIISKDNANIFYKHYQGTMVYLFVGKENKSGMSLEDWLLLCKHFDGCNLFVPVVKRKEARNMEIKRLRRCGQKINDLAQQFELTARQVINICNAV